MPPLFCMLWNTETHDCACAIIVFRKHHLHAVHGCGLLLPILHVAWSVCLHSLCVSVCRAKPQAVTKRWNEVQRGELLWDLVLDGIGAEPAGATGHSFAPVLLKVPGQTYPFASVLFGQ